MRFLLIFFFVLSKLFSQEQSVQIDYVLYSNTEFPSKINCKLFYKDNKSVFRYYLNSKVKWEESTNLNIIDESKLSDTESIITPGVNGDIYIKFDYNLKTLELIDNYVLYDMMNIKDVYPENTWVITNESKSLNNYTVFKALTRYRGRDWEVWFTTDLPISIGPWKLQGLPGVILSAKSKDERFQFIATSISFENLDLYFPDDGLKKITHQRILEEFEQLIFGSNSIDGYRDVTTEVSPRNGFELKYEWEE